MGSQELETASLRYILAQKRTGPTFAHTARDTLIRPVLHPSSAAAELCPCCANEFDLIMDSELEEILALLRSSQVPFC